MPPDHHFPGPCRDRLPAMNPDPNPDYDMSDEMEYFFSWLPWALRGTDWTGTPAYPPV